MDVLWAACSVPELLAIHHRFPISTIRRRRPERNGVRCAGSVLPLDWCEDWKLVSKDCYLRITEANSISESEVRPLDLVPIMSITSTPTSHSLKRSCITPSSTELSWSASSLLSFPVSSPVVVLILSKTERRCGLLFEKFQTSLPTTWSFKKTAFITLGTRRALTSTPNSSMTLLSVRRRRCSSLDVFSIPSLTANGALSVTLKSAIKLATQLNITPPANWSVIAENMNIIVDNRSGITVEFDGFNGSAEVKQADVVLLSYP